MLWVPRPSSSPSSQLFFVFRLEEGLSSVARLAAALFMFCKEISPGELFFCVGAAEKPKPEAFWGGTGH